MQREAGTRYIAIDQAGIGREVIESGGTRRTFSERRKYRGHGRPRLSAQWIVGAVAVTASIADPSDGPAIAHGHRHTQAAGSFQMSKWGRRFNFAYLWKQGA